MSETKKPAKIAWQMKGEIDLADGVTLDSAMAHLKEVEAKAREIGTAEAKVSVPRLVRVSLSEV